MGRKGIAILKGIEAKEVIEMLNRAYCDEWLAYYQYYIEAKVIKGIMKDAAIAELIQHAADELRHADLLAKRIIQLGGTPVVHPKEWFAKSNCGYEAPENFDVQTVLQEAIRGEACAIKTYAQIAETTQGKDIVTYDMISGILADEVEHEEDLQALYEDIHAFAEQFRVCL